MNTLFIRIWLALFLTGAGTFFLLMVLSAKMMSETGSSFLANAVVLTVWLPAVIAVPLIRAAVKRYAPRTILVGSEIGSVATVPHYFTGEALEKAYDLPAFSRRLAPSPFQAQGDISPGKSRTPSLHNRRIYAA